MLHWAAPNLIELDNVLVGLGGRGSLVATGLLGGNSAGEVGAVGSTEEGGSTGNGDLKSTSVSE